MKTGIKYLASLTMWSTMAFAAGTTTPAPSATAASTPPMRVSPLDSMSAKLEAAFKDLGPQPAAIPDLYPVAKARIQETQVFLKEDPKSKQAHGWIQACSLLTEGAVAQMQARLRQSERIKLQEQRVDALGRIDSIQEEINKLQRGYTSSLKADLEEQRRKAMENKADADKRFNELQSALIQVHKDARGTIISMSDILFEVGKASLTTDLKTSLAKIAGILTVYKDANVVVEGHTDNQGSEDLNQKLSEKRASNVMEFIMNPGGIDPGRLSAVGYGFTKPVADNATKEGRQKNRRVDLVILDKKAAP